MGKIRREVRRVAEVLGGDEVGLRPGGPFTAGEQRRGGFAGPVPPGAVGEERGDAVVLRAEGEQGCWGVREGAGLQERAEELAALGEAEEVPPGGGEGGGEREEGGADVGELRGEVPEEGGLPVEGGGGREGDDVYGRGGV